MIVTLDRGWGSFPVPSEKDTEEKLWAHVRLEALISQSWDDLPEGFLAGCEQEGSRPQGRGKGRTNGREWQGH